MSEQQELFLKEIKLVQDQWKKTLKNIFIPVISAILIMSIAGGVATFYTAKSNTRRVEIVEKNSVSQEQFIQFMDENRRAQAAAIRAMDTDNNNDMNEFYRINARIDDLIRDMYPYATRGGLTHPDNIN